MDKVSAKNFIKDKGFALFIAISMLAIISMMGFAFVTLTNQDYIFARQTILREQAYYLAESGVEYSLAHYISWVEFPHTDTLTFDNGGKVEIRVEDTSGTGDTITIKSKGSIGSESRTLEIVYSSTGSISSWKEYRE